MKKLVILTGAGMSSESGIRTFRETGGLWEEYDVTEVASPMGWWKNRDLTKARSTADPSLIYEIGYKEIKPGDTCKKGSQLRPHIVWFGEAVPVMDEAVQITSAADIFVVIGSSLNVYPAAGLIEYAPENASLWLIDPNEVIIPAYRKVEVIKAKASEGVRILTERLIH